MKILKPNRGMVLLGLALFAVVILSVVVGSYALLTLTQGKTTATEVQMEKALYVAEAGINDAIAELSSGDDPAGDGVGTITGVDYGGGSYAVSAVDLGGGNFQLTSTASLDELRRSVEVVVAEAPAVPIPGLSAQAALAIYGEAKKKKIKLEIGHDNDRDEVLISGFDAAGGTDLPAVGMNDADNYVEIAAKLTKRFDDGKLSPDQMIGDPEATLTSRRGNVYDTSFVQLKSATLDAIKLSEIATKIDDVATNVLTPAADRVLTDARDEHINVSQEWGTVGSPQITVVNGDKLKIENGATVTGHGTLIVYGGIDIHNGSTLDWTGDVIVLGNDAGRRGHEAKIKNSHGTLHVTGNLVAVGAQKGKAKIDLHDDNSGGDGEDGGGAVPEDASTHITGGILVVGGTDDREKSEFKIHHGSVQVDGFLGVVGDKAKLNAHKARHDKKFVVNGGVVVAIPPVLDRTNKAEVKLRGHATITYDSRKVTDALNGLLKLAGMEGEDAVLQNTYGVVSWREVPAE